jgi:hypothetical protein
VGCHSIYNAKPSSGQGDPKIGAGAIHRLRDSRIPLSRIAALLDHSEVSAVTRAFVRWFGVPPAEWRKKP